MILLGRHYQPVKGSCSFMGKPHSKNMNNPCCVSYYIHVLCEGELTGRTGTMEAKVLPIKTGSTLMLKTSHYYLLRSL